MKRGCLAVVGLLLLTGCTGHGKATRQPPKTISSSDRALGVVPAAPSFTDRYAGFELSIPTGWVRYGDSGIYSFAASSSRLAATDLGVWGDPSTFTVWVRAEQNESFAQAVASSRNDFSPGYGTWKEKTERISGRPARTLIHRAPNGGPNGECACVDHYTIIAWSSETVLWITAHAGSQKTFDQFRADADRIVASLRAGLIDARAASLRRFLRDRIAGHGAETWLTHASAAAYHHYGLYTN